MKRILFRECRSRVRNTYTYRKDRKGAQSIFPIHVPLRRNKKRRDQREIRNRRYGNLSSKFIGQDEREMSLALSVYSRFIQAQNGPFLCRAFLSSFSLPVDGGEITPAPDKLSPNYEGRRTWRLHVTPATIKRTLRSFLIVEKSLCGIRAALRNRAGSRGCATRDTLSKFDGEISLRGKSAISLRESPECPVRLMRVQYRGLNREID